MPCDELKQVDIHVIYCLSVDVAGTNMYSINGIAVDWLPYNTVLGSTVTDSTKEFMEVLLRNGDCSISSIAFCCCVQAYLMNIAENEVTVTFDSRCFVCFVAFRTLTHFVVVMYK